MLFNLDKQTKQNILEHYKQEALRSRLKKEEEKKREMEEDRNNLQQKEKRQKETIDMMNKEIIFNRNKLKNEYNLMLQKTKGYMPRKTDIIINNWGQPKEPIILPKVKINNYSINKSFSSKSFLNKNNKKDFVHLTQIQKEKEILKQIDHMDEYLTDKQNINEVKQFFLMQKENRYNFFKDLLYSQYKNAINKNLNLYGTKDELLLKERKKKFICDNPYIKKRKYESGSSSLEHNPIVNPENNYNYNKYINYKDFALSLNNNKNDNKLNNLNSFDNYLNNNQNINNIQNNNLNNNNLNNNLKVDNNANYRYNNIMNNNYDIKDRNTINTNEISSKGNILNNNYYNNNNPNSLKITKNQLIFNVKSQRNKYNNDYNLKRNFSQGDIYN